MMRVEPLALGGGGGFNENPTPLCQSGLCDHGSNRSAELSPDSRRKESADGRVTGWLTPGFTVGRASVRHLARRLRGQARYVPRCACPPQAGMLRRASAAMIRCTLCKGRGIHAAAGNS